MIHANLSAAAAADSPVLEEPLPLRRAAMRGDLQMQPGVALALVETGRHYNSEQKPLSRKIILFLYYSHTIERYVYCGNRVGHSSGVPRLIRAVLILLLAVVLVSSADATQAPASEEVHQFLKDVTVRIDIDAGALREICTGWIGWSEPAGSAVYTAAHCFRESGHYRLTLSSGDTVYASSLVRWTELDLMALWIDRGQLRAIRSWKPIPETGFRALYVLNADGRKLELIETQVSRIYREIQFENSPAAVAIPIHVLPGTSGAPILDLTDGVLLGMVVGRIPDRLDITAVIPANLIHKALADAAEGRQTPK